MGSRMGWITMACQVQQRKRIKRRRKTRKRSVVRIKVILRTISLGQLPFLARKNSTTTVQTRQVNNRKRVQSHHKGKKYKWYTSPKHSKVLRAWRNRYWSRSKSNSRQMRKLLWITNKMIWKLVKNRYRNLLISRKNKVFKIKSQISRMRLIKK